MCLEIVFTFSKKRLSPEKIFFLNFYPVYISVTARVRDVILTLKYAGCFPIAKAVFIVWIRRPSPEKIENEKRSSLYFRQPLRLETPYRHFNVRGTAL